jgi:uncharacterized protein (DUF362 family)
MEKTVLVMRCETYDRDKVQGLVTDGMQHLGYNPSGKIFVKPNVVFAYKKNPYGVHAYTHTDVVGPTLLTLSRGEGVTRVDLGENSAVAMPTRLCYRFAGYYNEIRRVRAQASCPVDIFCIDEEPRDSVFVGGRVHDNLRIARRMARADSMVYLPKLKGHCVSNMTGAVKLNIGICSDDERSIRHDFLLNEKIVDLLGPGWPDFVVMDAIEVGVGNEAVPTPRTLGLLLMGRNPLAVDLVATRLMGLQQQDVPYLQAAVDRGYSPASLEEVKLDGDLTGIDDLDAQAKRILPYDDAFYRWQDVSKELERLRSPIRFFWGPYGRSTDDRCLTGCVMGLKMFLGFFEQYAGAEAFARAKPVSIVMGRYAGELDARGHEVFLIGSCARARVVNASKITRIDKCFTTAGDMMQTISLKLGMPSPFMDPVFLFHYLGAILTASIKKVLSLRYFQDIGYFLTKKLLRRV